MEEESQVLISNEEIINASADFCDQKSKTSQGSLGKIQRFQNNNNLPHDTNTNKKGQGVINNNLK